MNKQPIRKVSGTEKKNQVSFMEAKQIGAWWSFYEILCTGKKKGIKKVCNAKIHRFYVKWQKLRVAEDTYNISSF